MVFQYKGIETQQLEAELREFIELCKEHHVKSILEIGIASGGTTQYIYDALQPDLYVGLDIVPFHREVGPDFIFVQENSNSAEARYKIRTISRKYDLVFIDGDHTGDHPIADFDHYSPYASKIIAFHDINNPNVDICYAVARTRYSYPYKAIRIEPNDQPTWNGIGMIFVPLPNL